MGENRSFETNGNPAVPHSGSTIPLRPDNEPQQLPIGAILNGRYSIGKVIGQGGFGITYFGRDLKLNMSVAIKEYYPSGMAYRYHAQSLEVSVSSQENSMAFSQGKRRFLDEARTMALFVDEPNVVGVRDYFEANNTAYIVMEYLEGKSLQEYSKTTGPMPFDTVFNMLAPVMYALCKIHQKGLIHRDISPSNLFLLPDGRVKILDFGTARGISAEGEKSLSVVLKPGYAPEEQYRTRGSQGGWTDVYALCASIYRLITGVIPENAMNRLYEDTVKKPSLLGARINPAQEAVLMHGLAVRASDRIQSMEELIAGFEAASYGQHGAQNGTLPPAQPKKQPPHPASYPSQTPKKAKRNTPRGIIAALLTVLAIIVVVGGVLIIRAARSDSGSNDSENNTTVERRSASRQASEDNSRSYLSDKKTETEEAKIDETKADDAKAGETKADETKADETEAGPKRTGVYIREDDDAVYHSILGEYEALLAQAKAASDNDERFVIYAQAEALLLDSAVMIPTTTRGGFYHMTRIAPRTVPYIQWGSDSDRLHSMVISDEFISREERADLMAAWEAAVAGKGTYDPAGYLIDKGHTIQTEYACTFSTAPVTIDWLNTASQADTEITVNCVDGLVEYNNLGQLTPALAEYWEVSDDGITYTFRIRSDVYWYTSEGARYAEVTAGDFVAGFHHMLDTRSGLEWLVEGVVKGASEYLAGGSFDAVGYKAVDDFTLVITLEQPTSYFLTMLTYSGFLPICDSFYQAHGGVYGITEYADASADTGTYTFGRVEDVTSQVYCGPFILQKLQADSEILAVRNPGYYRNDTTTLDTIKWINGNNISPYDYYNDAVAGIYASTGLYEANGTLDQARSDGSFEKYAYISDTESTTFFGGLNLNRGTFELESGACASPQTEDQKIDTHIAMQNKNFRKALQHAFDKGTQNAVVNGEELKYANLRNMYTHPEFVYLENNTTDQFGYTFPAGTFYGVMVQHYVDKLDPYINVSDGVDGWFNPDAAREFLAAAMEELGDSVSYPIQIDVVYYANDTQTAQAQAYKSAIEDTLGAENVVVNLIEAATYDDFYACGYRALSGEDGNFDMSYGSGWGPDFGDPCTYLDTFLGEGAGYMTRMIGLY